MEWGAVAPPRPINSQKCTRQTIPHPYGFWDSGSVLALALESIREKWFYPTYPVMGGKT
jgi:hypothetical protein